MSANIHWLTQISSHIPDRDDWLSEQEREISDQFSVPKRRDDWRLGRWTAKRAICAYQVGKDLIPLSLEIRAAADGAPEPFYQGEPVPVSISISHSKNRGLCAVGHRGIRIGCDLEWIEPREERFAADYFTAEEISFALRMPVERALIENLIWSAKETTLKIIRKGLTRDTRSVVIHPEFGGKEGLWNPWDSRCLESSQVFHGWWRTCEGYVYTIASDQITAVPQQLKL
jgi:4'-phosphopantetheinyl transferase